MKDKGAKKKLKEKLVEIILPDGTSRQVKAARIQDTPPEQLSRALYNDQDNIIGYIPVDAYIVIHSYIYEDYTDEKQEENEDKNTP